MERVLNRALNARPMEGFDSWEQAKSLLFGVLGYDVHTEDAAKFHKSNATRKIVTAPAREGKSYAAAHDPIPYCLPTRPSSDTLIWSIGPTYKTNAEFNYLHSIFVANRQKLWSTGWKYEIERENNSPLAGDMEIRFVKERRDGRTYRTRIMGLSASNEEALQGEEVTYTIQSEAAEHPDHVYKKYLDSRTWFWSAPTTPKQKAVWLKEMCDQAPLHPEMDIEHIHFKSEEEWKHLSYEEWQKKPNLQAYPYDFEKKGCLVRWNANPTYDWVRYRTAMAGADVRAKALIGPHATAKDDPYFAEQFLGRWSFYAGRVLPFQRNRHVVHPHAFGRDLSRFKIMVSTDHGFDHPAAALFWAILPGPTFFLFDAIYERKLTSERFADAIHRMASKNGVEPSAYVGDPRKPEVENVFRRAGLPIVTMNKTAQSDRAAGYRRTIDAMTEGPHVGFPGIFVASHLNKVIEEFEQLHYREGHNNEYSESAIKGADHAVDATRYFLMTNPQEGRPANREPTLDEVMRERRKRQQKSTSTDYTQRLGAHRFATPDSSRHAA